MWMIGLLLRGAIEMVMIEWARMDLEERQEGDGRIVQVDVWIGGREVLWMWWVRRKSEWRQRKLLRRLRQQNRGKRR